MLTAETKEKLHSVHWVYEVRPRNFRPDILRMNELKWNPNQFITLSYSASLVERIKFQSYWFQQEITANRGKVCWTAKIDKVGAVIKYFCKKICPQRKFMKVLSFLLTSNILLNVLRRCFCCDLLFLSLYVFVYIYVLVIFFILDSHCFGKESVILAFCL